MKDIVILGGPNGAGKTTAAQVVLPEELGIIEFVNADEIARGLSPFNADRAARAAARLMITRMRDLALSGTSFAFETTCAGHGHAGFLQRLQAENWRVTLVYLWLPSPEAALDRVARRVRAGGHNISRDVVVRRYWGGLRNMRQIYLPLANAATIYDNSDDGRMVIADRAMNAPLVVHDPTRWELIEKATA